MMKAMPPIYTKAKTKDLQVVYVRAFRRGIRIMAMYQFYMHLHCKASGASERLRSVMLGQHSFTRPRHWSNVHLAAFERTAIKDNLVVLADFMNKGN